MAANTKPQKVATALRALAERCITAANLIESKNQIERAIGRLMYRQCAIEGYLPWLRLQYKEWRTR